MCEDDEIPSSDDLQEIGFEWSSDGYSLYYKLGVGNIRIVCGVVTNLRSDYYLSVKSLSLYWKYYGPNSVSMTYGIRDNPTLKQIVELIRALKGE
jgi:hypothetical protein